MVNPIRANAHVDTIRDAANLSARPSAIPRTGIDPAMAERLRPVLNDAAQRIDPPPGRTAARADGPDPRELSLDVTQMALDIAGIFEPTPFADGANTLISLGRGDLLGAGLSAAGMIPYVGDLAKLGKLGRWAETVSKSVDMALTNSAARQALEPALRKLNDTLAAIPQAALNKLPAEARGELVRMQDKLDTLFGAGAARATSRSFGRNDVAWRTDDQGRVVEARAQLRDVHSGLDRSPAEQAAQRRAADRGIEGDHGGHAIPHRFVGDQGDINLFPQNGVPDGDLKNFNGSAFKKVENEIADWVDAGAEVDYTVKFSEFDANNRPMGVDISYTVTDPETGREIYRNAREFDNVAGQDFDRLSRANIAERFSE